MNRDESYRYSVEPTESIDFFKPALINESAPAQYKKYYKQEELLRNADDLADQAKISTRYNTLLRESLKTPDCYDSKIESVTDKTQDIAMANHNNRILSLNKNSNRGRYYRTNE